MKYNVDGSIEGTLEELIEHTMDKQEDIPFTSTISIMCPRCWNECTTHNEWVRGQCDACTAQDVEEERDRLERE